MKALKFWSSATFASVTSVAFFAVSNDLANLSRIQPGVGGELLLSIVVFYGAFKFSRHVLDELLYEARTSHHAEIMDIYKRGIR